LADGSTAFIAERCEIELDHPVEFCDVEDKFDCGNHAGSFAPWPDT
jgi:hypothetical protein